jgi:hypothetical protein
MLENAGQNLTKTTLWVLIKKLLPGDMAPKRKEEKK